MSEERLGIIALDEIVLINRYMKSPKKKWARFIGMNYWAAKELEVPFPYSNNTAVIVKPQWYLGDTWTVKRVLKHEQAESAYMQLGLNYKEAHRRTLDLVGSGSITPVEYLRKLFH
jgi:hypothetical protein